MSLLRICDVPNFIYHKKLCENSCSVLKHYRETECADMKESALSSLITLITLSPGVRVYRSVLLPTFCIFHEIISVPLLFAIAQHEICKNCLGFQFLLIKKDM